MVAVSVQLRLGEEGKAQVLIGLNGGMVAAGDGEVDGVATLLL